MTPLRQKMVNDMKLRRLAPKTQEAYVDAVAGLAKHYNQSPELLDKEKLQSYSFSDSSVSASGFSHIRAEFYLKAFSNPPSPPFSKVGDYWEL